MGQGYAAEKKPFLTMAQGSLGSGAVWKCLPRTTNRSMRWHQGRGRTGRLDLGARGGHAGRGRSASTATIFFYHACLRQQVRHIRRGANGA